MGSDGRVRASCASRDRASIIGCLCGCGLDPPEAAGRGTDRNVRLWPERVKRAVSSVGRAPALHAGCHRFESCTAHQTE